MIRHWILDPAGHRKVEQLEMHVNAPAGAILVVADDVWICDQCNATIDTSGAVACEGSYALCSDCAYARFTAEPNLDGPIPSTLLFPDPRWWSAHSCACGACTRRAEQWAGKRAA